MIVFKLWSEWDFGQDAVLFSTEQKAYDWLKSNKSFKDFLENTETTLEEYTEDGYISVEPFLVQ